jgi:hypothetical protein
MTAAHAVPQPPTAPHAHDRAGSDRRLFERYLDDRDRVDRDAIVERFLPLARHLAARYQRADEPFDDIFHVACYALVKAGRPLRRAARRGVLELCRPYDHRRDQAPLPRPNVGRARPARPAGPRAARRARNRPAHPRPRTPAQGRRGRPGDRRRARRRPRGDRGLKRLPRDIAANTAGLRRRNRPHTWRQHRDDRRRLPPRRAARCPSRAHALADRARARGGASALRGGPHTGGDQRAHRRQSDAGSRACCAARSPDCTPPRRTKPPRRPPPSSNRPRSYPSAARSRPGQRRPSTSGAALRFRAARRSRADVKGHAPPRGPVHVSRGSVGRPPSPRSHARANADARGNPGGDTGPLGPHGASVRDSRAGGPPGRRTDIALRPRRSADTLPSTPGRALRF